MTKFQAAEYLGIHHQTLDKYRGLGLLDPTRNESDGGRITWTYDQHELERFKASFLTCECGRERKTVSPVNRQLALV